MSEYIWSWSFSGRSVIGPTCPNCQTIHGSNAAMAVGRFNRNGVRGYRSRLGGSVRRTRGEAVADFCASVQA